MKLIFAGTPANAARTLQALLQGPHQVVAVLTRPDAPVGRKRILTSSPTAQVAEAAGIPVFKATRVDQTLATQLAATGAEVGIIVAYGALLKDFALKALPKGWLNLHYSLLPDWRGAAPVQNSILAGDSITGVTLFQLVEGMDTGPILDTVATQIQPDETSGRLLERLTELGITLLNQALPSVEAGIARFSPQPDAQGAAGPASAADGQPAARPANKLTRDDARIDWTKPAKAIELQVRAMNPEPMAHTSIGDDSFRIMEARVAPYAGGDAEPGTLIHEAKRVLVECGNHDALQLITVQPAGKNPMLATDWARGAAGKVNHLG